MEAERIAAKGTRCYAHLWCQHAEDREGFMSTVEEITAAIAQLPSEEIGRVQAWLAEFAERRWDEQIERDESEGRLDALIEKALTEHREGRTRPL